MQTAPCAWPVQPECCPAWDGATAEQRANAAAIATEILWALTGRRFGVCPVTVRPCREPCTRTTSPLFLPYYGGGSYTPRLLDGAWINGCGECVTDCSCGPMCKIVLPGPVDSVLEVRHDGDVLPAGAYVVYDHRELVRVDGECWPDCQDLTAAADQPGTLAVTYGLGTPVPAAGIAAASAYACEILKSCLDLPCRLPRRVTNITRQGVTYSLLDPMEMLTDGLTGLYEVDAWIIAVNPARLGRGARVYSPDRRPPRRQSSP